MQNPVNHVIAHRIITVSRDDTDSKNAFKQVNFLLVPCIKNVTLSILLSGKAVNTFEEVRKEYFQIYQ